MNDHIFEINQVMLEGKNNIIPENADVFYKDLDKEKTIIFFKEAEIKHTLIIFMKKHYISGQMDLPSIRPQSGFAWTMAQYPDFAFYAGVMTDENMNDVQVTWKGYVEKVITY
ncbi:hypothetical protein [Virgibacillus pantothenticus]|uniref:Uncharacterized protein n=1 Tax=Virgibacillus pantothenticus TaxID=1473 RepID=A0A0L0QKQ3_VIRPA|nr:hypothetical protein [Virgibacillus pantothenticus]KNE19141.1 hypothetical protein AFK71_11370 [Virgibacillus pantothenticus]MED3738120.1 hypothetical protein [Virgibacillus pantothenticus]QTY15596.1 hypothetical protein KBP50_17175 [Virgibacillus pantothenticus]